MMQYRIKQDQDLTFKPKILSSISGSENHGKVGVLISLEIRSKYWEVTKRAINNKMHIADLVPRDENLISNYRECTFKVLLMLYLNSQILRNQKIADL